MYNDQFASSTNFPDGVKIIKNEQDETIGFIALGVHSLEQSNLSVYLMEIIEGVSWFDIKDVILHYCIQQGEKLAAESEDTFQGIAFVLGKKHPFYNVLTEDQMIPSRGFPGYIQINNLVGFFNSITKVLEQRIENSTFEGYSSRFSINLTQESLTQLIFGWKGLDELLVDYPEVGFHNDVVEALIRILFPKESSFIPF